ncbi:MAG: hypothetical protein ACYC3L_00315 [Gemmatimonadaceae bacterium]
MDHDEGGATQWRAEAIEAWARTANAVLCGLNHALSNRVSALVMVFHSDQGVSLAATEINRLSTETTKLEELLRLYRLLARSELATPEPIGVPDAVSDALSLVAHHPDVGDLAWTVTGDADTPPVLLIPSALVHALVHLLCTAAASADADAPALRLTYGGDPDWVTIAVETCSSAAKDQSAQSLEAATVGFLLPGAVVTRLNAPTREGGVQLEVRLPTLANQRRHERGVS